MSAPPINSKIGTVSTTSRVSVYTLELIDNEMITKGCYFSLAAWEIKNGFFLNPRDTTLLIFPFDHNILRRRNEFKNCHKKRLGVKLYNQGNTIAGILGGWKLYHIIKMQAIHNITFEWVILGGETLKIREKYALNSDNETDQDFDTRYNKYK
jgi:hypothetical protein